MSDRKSTWRFDVCLHAKVRFAERVAPYFDDDIDYWLKQCKNPREKEIRKVNANWKSKAYGPVRPMIIVRRKNALVFVALLKLGRKINGIRTVDVKTFIVYENDQGHLKRFNVPITKIRMQDGRSNVDD